MADLQINEKVQHASATILGTRLMDATPERSRNLDPALFTLVALPRLQAPH